MPFVLLTLITSINFHKKSPMNLILGPPEIISFGTSNGKKLSHDAAGTIRCEVTAMPEAKVTILRKNGKNWKNIDSVSREQVGNKMTADYSIPKVDIADHFGAYKCEARNEFQDNAVVNETFVYVTREFGEGKFNTVFWGICVVFMAFFAVLPFCCPSFLICFSIFSVQSNNFRRQSRHCNAMQNSSLPETS